MKCPCLRETSVHSCSASSVRKMIATQALGPGEKCITAAYRTCAAYTEPGGGSEVSATCPFLRESVVQYCAAAGAPQYVPWSEHSFSRCGASGHRYCELYLQLAGVPHDIESRLRFTRNHFWFDSDEDGWWHAGIDALLARALGKVDAIAFVPGESYHSVVVTADGTDWVLTLPHKVRVASFNSWLRADPGRLTRSPYSSAGCLKGREAFRQG